MPIPIHVLYGLVGILAFVSILFIIFSISASKGVSIMSCKGDGSCGCEGDNHHNTAEKILALINKD